MQWRTDYEEELIHVFGEAERMIKAYPTPLNEKGLAYLQAFNPLLPASTKNHICYLLTFWMKPLTRLDSPTNRHLSVANVLLMLYFFIQDDLMDTAPEDWKEQLALGNLFHISLLELYREKFDSTSMFWSQYRKYITEWSIAVANERPTSHLSAVQLAQKASPVKLASTGALLLAGRIADEAIVSSAVDLVLGTLQLSDDLADWEEDFDLANANSLIAMIASEKNDPSVQLTKAEVKNAIFINGALERFAQLAISNSLQLNALQVNLPHLMAFHDQLAAKIIEAAEDVEHTKKQLLCGGFSYWLSNNAASTVMN